MIRYLVKHDLVFAKTYKVITAADNWRVEFFEKPENVLTDQVGTKLREILSCGFLYFAARDKGLRPVLFCNAKKIKEHSIEKEWAIR